MRVNVNLKAVTVEDLKARRKVSRSKTPAPTHAKMLGPECLVRASRRCGIAG